MGSYVSNASLDASSQGLAFSAHCDDPGVKPDVPQQSGGGSYAHRCPSSTSTRDDFARANCYFPANA
eukprot:11944714-Karenia_brevis.AAC.1